MAKEMLPWDLQMELLKQQEEQALADAHARRLRTGSSMNPGAGKPTPTVKMSPAYEPPMSGLGRNPTTAGSGVFRGGPAGIVKGAAGIASPVIAGGLLTAGIGPAMDLGEYLGQAALKAREIDYISGLRSLDDLSPNEQARIRGIRSDMATSPNATLPSIEELLGPSANQESAATPQAAAPTNQSRIASQAGSSAQKTQGAFNPYSALTALQSFRSQPVGPGAASSEQPVIDVEAYSPEEDLSAFVPNDGPEASATDTPMDSRVNELINQSVSTDSYERGAQPVGDSQSVGDPYIDRLLALLENKQAPVQEELDPASVESLNALSKNKSEYTPPAETFGRKLKRFVVAGAGPVDFTRLDRQEQELHQSRNALTDRERLRAGVADRTISGAQQFNRQQVGRNEETGGMSPQTRFALDLIGGDRSADRSLRQQKDLSTHQSKLRREEMGVKQDPEVANMQFLRETATRYPDLLPSVFQQMGVRLEPEALKSIQQGRSSGNTMRDQLLLEIIKERMGNLRGNAAGKSASSNVNLKALAAPGS